MNGNAVAQDAAIRIFIELTKEWVPTGYKQAESLDQIAFRAWSLARKFCEMGDLEEWDHGNVGEGGSHSMQIAAQLFAAYEAEENA